MTDLENVIKMCESREVPFERSERFSRWEGIEGNVVELRFDTGDDPNIGYSGFSACMYFTLSGDFIAMGAWE